MKRFIKLIMCIISVCCIFVSMCPISAFATPDSYHQIASDKPIVDNYSGYVELLYEIKTTGEQFVVVLGWTFTPLLNTSNDFYIVSDKPILTIVRNEEQFRLGVSTSSGVSGYISFITTYSVAAGSEVYFGVMNIPDDESTKYYNFTLGSNYKLVGMHYYGDFQNLLIDNALPNEEFYVVYGSDVVVTYGLNQLISGIYTLIDISGQESYKDELDAIIDGINNLDSSLSSYRDNINLKFNLMFSWFTNFLDSLNSIVDNTDELEEKLDEIWAILFEINNWVYYIYEYMPWLYGELVDIHSLLQSILDILSAQGSQGEKLTQPDNSDMDNYYDVENGLIGNGSGDVNGAVNVQVNQNAMSVIWDLVERALNSHAKVIGMVLTILALGIVALILGR